MEGEKELGHASAGYLPEKEYRHNVAATSRPSTSACFLASPHTRLSTCSIQLFSGMNLGSGHQSRLEGRTGPSESQESEDGIWDKHAMNTGMLG